MISDCRGGAGVVGMFHGFLALFLLSTFLIGTSCRKHERNNPFDPGSPDFIPPPTVTEIHFFFFRGPPDTLYAVIYLEGPLEQKTPIEHVYYLNSTRIAARVFEIDAGVENYAVGLMGSFPNGTYLLRLYYGGVLIGEGSYALGGGTGDRKWDTKQPSTEQPPFSLVLPSRSAALVLTPGG